MAFYGGAQKVLAIILRLLKENGYGVKLLVLNRSEKEVEVDGVEIEWILEDVSQALLPNSFLILDKIAKALRHKMHKYLQAVDCVISYKLCDGILQSLMESVASNRWIITKELTNHAMLLEHKRNAYLIESLDELKDAFTYVQNHKVEKSYNSLLDIDAQRKKYLEILKENFDV